MNDQSNVPNEELGVMKEILSTLKELLNWNKILGAKEVKNTLEIKLNTDVKKLIYSKSDGNRGTRDIAGDIQLDGKVSHMTVSNYWQEWLIPPAIGEPIPVRGGGSRFKHSFDLKSFGIDVLVNPNVAKAASDAVTELGAEQNVI